MAISVLVVEDNDLMRNSVASALTLHGMNPLFTAKTSAEAIRTGAKEFPQVAVLDLHLGPGPNGVDVALALRKQNPQIGIVFLTTYEDPRLISEKRPLPRASHYLVKNKVTDIDALTQVIEAALGAKAKSETTGQGEQSAELKTLQYETLRLVAQGLSNAEIAKLRNVSEKSVEAILTRISKALEIPQSPSHNTRVQLVRKYFELSGIPPYDG